MYIVILRVLFSPVLQSCAFANDSELALTHNRHNILTMFLSKFVSLFSCLSISDCLKHHHTVPLVEPCRCAVVSGNEMLAADEWCPKSGLKTYCGAYYLVQHTWIKWWFICRPLQHFMAFQGGSWTNWIISPGTDSKTDRTLALENWSKTLILWV